MPPATETILDNRMATVIEVRLAVALIERSIPPVSIVIATANDNRPMTLLCSNIEFMFAGLRKVSGLAMPSVPAIRIAASKRVAKRESMDCSTLIVMLLRL